MAPSKSYVNYYFKHGEYHAGLCLPSVVRDTAFTKCEFHASCHSVQFIDCTFVGCQGMIWIKNATTPISFVGIDDFNRPVFKHSHNKYYGSLDILFPYGASKADVLKKVKANDIVYFGRTFNCEPMGTPAHVRIV